VACNHLYNADARDKAFGSFTADVILTKLPTRSSVAFRFLRDLQEKQRADERTRTADLSSLRVISQALQRFA
jgi:hypothetical protein